MIVFFSNRALICRLRRLVYKSSLWRRNLPFSWSCDLSENFKMDALRMTSFLETMETNVRGFLDAQKLIPEGYLTQFTQCNIEFTQLMNHNALSFSAKSSL